MCSFAFCIDNESELLSNKINNIIVKEGQLMGHCRKKMISFFITTDCNLACDYCYIDKDDRCHNNEVVLKNETIDINFAKVGFDFFYAQGITHLRFFGPGEPTMRIDIIKEIINYARKKANEKITLEIQTNGAFSDSIARYLAHEFDIIWISSDGLPVHHDAHRKTKSGRITSDIIERNIHYLIKYGKGMTGIRATITKDNVNLQSETLLYFKSLGVKYVWTDPIFPPLGETEESFEGVNLMDFANGMLSAQKVAKEQDMICGSLLTSNFDEKVMINCRACLPMPHLTTDGYISACDLALFGNIDRKDKMTQFIYGKWNEKKQKIDFDDTKMQLLQSRNAINMPGCQNCIAQYHCAGWCLGEILNETDSLFGQKPGHCEAIRFLYKHKNELDLNYKYLHP